MIWATVSHPSCFSWLYRASPPLATKNIINLISVLAIWWCPCVESCALFQQHKRRLYAWTSPDDVCVHIHLYSWVEKCYLMRLAIWISVRSLHENSLYFLQYNLTLFSVSWDVGELKCIYEYLEFGWIVT